VPQGHQMANVALKAMKMYTLRRKQLLSQQQASSSWRFLAHACQSLCSLSSSGSLSRPSHEGGKLTIRFCIIDIPFLCIGGELRNTQQDSQVSSCARSSQIWLHSRRADNEKNNLNSSDKTFPAAHQKKPATLCFLVAKGLMLSSCTK
jgi:hypothetical protein